MNEYVKGVHNHIEWTDDALNERLKLLSDNMDNINYTGERLQQVQREIGLIAFELSCRYGEEHDKPWND